MTDRLADIAEETLSWELQVGYGSRAYLVQCLDEVLRGDDLEVADGAVAELVDGALSRRGDEEAAWEDPTDHDRLVAALAELDRAGIVAREDYGATRGDAERAVAAEAARLAGDGATVRGICTFDRQDAERAAGDGRLFLSYAAFAERSPAADAAIGAEVMATLRAHELGVEWNGQASERLAVLVPDWRVRRVTGDRARPSLRGWDAIWGDP